jgi:glycosyltransferase involved in cell wall biosynthesis
VETHYGLQLRHVGYVPHGLRDRAAAARTPPVAVPSGDSANGPLVLFVGRLERRKGVDVLLAAIERLFADGSGARFALVGADAPLAPGEPTVRETFIARHGPDPRVTFAGQMGDDELWAWYAAADIVVVPSRFESFGLTAIEGMMFAKPVVAARAGGLEAIVSDGVTGLLTLPADADDLAAALRALLASPRLRTEMGRHGRSVFEARYSQEAMARGVLTFYRAVLSR